MPTNRPLPNGQRSRKASLSLWRALIFVIAFVETSPLVTWLKEI